MVPVVAIVVLACGAAIPAAAPEPTSEGAAVEPCKEATPTSTPCAGIVVPADQAKRAIRCERVDLPACRSDLELAKRTAEVELEAERQRTAIQRARGDKLAKLLEDVTATPAPRDDWRIVSAVVGGLVAAASAVVCGVERDRTEMVVPFAILGAGGLALTISAVALE